MNDVTNKTPQRIVDDLTATLPVFPVTIPSAFGNVIWNGMQLRDYFAAQALPAIIEARRGLGEEAAAKSAYAHADAMLAARERK